ncbi:MAG TPA: Ig-like domain-containing protein [Chitinophagaceae bacterium]|nr:Ig-like domain-containing protein [Chitinophagaceae bacterium]
MSASRILFIFSILFIIGTSIISGPGCANIVPPSGGPKDSLPPLLRKAEPGDSTLNFTGTRLSFTFDEYVEIQNIQQELLVSPTPRNTPVVNWRLNTVTVRLRDSLEPNTTYTLNFGNAIKDLNEGNVLKDFSYTFSTGSYLDSLKLRGNVVLAETGKTDTTMIVMLHSNGADSAVVNEKPRYVAKLDSKGGFVFNNLPPRTYYLYALKDESGARRYMNDKQLFAFADSAVIISDTIKPVTLYAYSRQPAPATTAPPVSISPGGRIPRGQQSTDRRLKFTTNLVNDQQDLLGSFILSFEQPLRSFDSSKLSLFTDSTFAPAPAFRFLKDSTNRQLVLEHSWKENTLYHLVLDKDFAEDSSGKKLLKTDTLSFRTRKFAEYGQLKVKIRDLDLSKNPVLIFVLNGTPRQSFPMTSTELTQNLFLPGEYELRVLYDDNLNGKWDPGQFFGERRQPELVKPIDRKLVIRPNWENEFEIAL